MKIGIHFTDIYDVSVEVLEKYGAFNISLISDMPLFIDPFLLFSSEKVEYQQLHNNILKYLTYLKDKAEQGIPTALVEDLYSFHEVKQNWLGYSEFGNHGRGLGRQFAINMHNAMPLVFKNIGHETITATSHLEKVCLFNDKIGRDNISDFTTNLIFEYLLNYTQIFAKNHIAKKYCDKFNVKDVYFDYSLGRWMPKSFWLPKYEDDFVLLTPKDLLTRDETWINSHDMIDHFQDISGSIKNSTLRASINEHFRSQIPVFEMSTKEKDKYIKAAKWSTIKQFPEIIEYYIESKENDKENAKSLANERMQSVEYALVTWLHSFAQDVLSQTRFFQISPDSSYREALMRVDFFKKCIEDNDVYKIFYNNGKPVKEEIIQLAFKLVWRFSDCDVNREVNNGRGPVDYKFSKGANDKTLVEFKLAKNSKLRKNLENQLDIYKNANDTQYGIVVIFYYSEAEKKKTESILKDLNLDDKENVVLVDCSPKESASNVG